MLKAFKKLWNDDRGNALILFGASLPLLVGAAGIATDTIQWTLWKRQLQRAADSGAIAGVYTRLNTDTEAAVRAAVNADLAINNHVGIALQSGFPAVTLPADDGDKEKQVRVVLQLSKALPFSSMFMEAAPNIVATATAASVPGGDQYCVIGLDKSASVTGVEISGSTFLDLGNCSLIANSKHKDKAASNGTSGNGQAGSGSYVKAASLAASGGVQYSNNWKVSDYDPNSPPADDPFAGVPSPTSCSKTVTISANANQGYPYDRTVAGGDVAGETVCLVGGGNGQNANTVAVKGAIKLQTGVTYVLNGQNLSMTDTSASLTCGGCTIAMTNFTNPANTGNIKITGGTVNLTAPTTGTYKGIAIYQDRLASDSGQKAQNHINGNSGQSITGAIYIPGRSILYNGGGNYVADSTVEGACMMLVAKRVEFGGNSKVKALDECETAGLPAPKAGKRVRLVA
ncbi:Tad domain-containing protein [Sphingomonas sp. NSE70-1]|uniref:Tad domain-containing protein n=1 Tax=Sphingomonas caseinilyticus TaxID=2908205 RepID=A0ABT0RSI9_9SPHN|nr:pilus assembly protein TadG-related protein [Sphingomonas caseinilyticus]MCL6697978.1 Tad domain-containing protein [Sphingomonas caseinilyticus]